MPPRPLQVFFSEQEENQQKQFGLGHLRDPAASGNIPRFSPGPSLQVVVQTVELSSQLVFKIKASVFISLLLCNCEWNNQYFFPGTQIV